MRHTIMLLFLLLSGGCTTDSVSPVIGPLGPRCMDYDNEFGCRDPGHNSSGPMLSFSVPPSGVATGTAITPTVRVRFFQAGGAQVGATDAITISISNNPGGATLSGTTPVVVGLDATFPDLSIDKQGEGYTLTVTATGFFSAVSPAFNVVACTCWSSRAPMPTARYDLGVGVVNGVVYAIGGEGTGSFGWSTTTLATVQAYDPVTNSWASRAPMPTPRSGLAVGVVDGVLYAIGGGRGFFSREKAGTVEAYDPVTNSWTTRAPMPTPRSGLAVGVVNGVLYAVGGADSISPLTTVEAYDPAANTWTTRASMPAPRSGLAVGVVNGVLYAVGDGIPPTVEAYDPVADLWTTRAPMPTSRHDLAVGVVNGLLYALGGRDGGGNHLAPVEVYDPEANSWTSRGPMLTSRYGLGVGVVNGSVYVVGGYSGYLGGGSLPTVEAYDPTQDD